MRRSCTARALSLLVFLLALGVGASSALADLGIPSDGLDLVELKDRRVIRCLVGEEAEGRLTIEMEGYKFRIPESDVIAIRYFRDFDSTPTNDAEKAKVEKGQVKWEGKWVAKKKADKLRAAEEARLRELVEEDEKHSDWKNRWILETKHFKIEANIPRAKLDHYAAMLEGYYENVGKQLGIQLRGKWKKFKLPVYFYKHREEYLKRRRDSGQDKGESALGHFVPTPDKEELVMFDQQENMAGTLEVLYHEGTHFLIYLAEPDLVVPRWLNEGCAEFYSGSKFEDGEYTPGLVHDGRVLGFMHNVKRGKIESLEQLFQSGNPGAEAGLQRFPPSYYDQSWLIAHYCMNTKKYRKRWQTYFKKIMTRKVKTQAIEASSRKFVHYDEDLALFKQSMKIKDTKKFQQELLKYANTLPLRESQGYVQLGIMRWTSGDSEGAKEAWQAAEKVAGEDADALFELAMIYRFQTPDKRALAQRYFRKAVDLDPLDVRKRYMHAQILTDANEALKQLRICQLIEPDRPAVLTDLAVLLFNEKVLSPHKPGSEAEKKSVDEAFAFARRAVEVAPDHRSRHILAILHMQRGEFDEAYALQEKAVQAEADNIPYREWLAKFAALRGDGANFAKTMRKSLLLLRQATDGDTKRATADIERSTRTIITACMAWGRLKECAEVLKVWYRLPPRTESEWRGFIRVLRMARDTDGARDAVKGAKEAFPDENFSD